MIYVNGAVVNAVTFPNQEQRIDFDMSAVYLDKINVIELRYQSDQDLMHLLFITDAIRNAHPKALLALKLPYLPYSRMDRQESTALFTLKTITKFINNMNFEYVEVWEAHSNVGLALLDTVVHYNKSYTLALQFLRELLGYTGEDDKELYELAAQEGVVFVYPDEGAKKRYHKANHYQNIITASKDRNFDTGRIENLELNIKSVKNMPTKAIIIDDLSSMGWTFLLTAQELQKHGINEIYLVVTHCEDTIFKGDILKTDTISKVITTNSVLTMAHDKIKIYE